MRRGLAAAIAGFAATAVFAVPAQAGSNHESIVDTAVAASGGGQPDSNPNDYDLLVQAVTATDLAPTLDDEDARFTVFAPTDRAFLRLVKDLTGEKPESEQEALETITGALTTEQIKNVLLYHVVANRQLNLKKVQKSRRIRMANGGIVRPRGRVLKDETRSAKDPKVVKKASNIRTANGIIHTIDRVLRPRG
jgi:uncharacterized surface protein with fasciclin (FAS1) repeats